MNQRLNEAKRQSAPLKSPCSEKEIIAALGDVSGLWEFLIPVMV